MAGPMYANGLRAMLVKRNAYASVSAATHVEWPAITRRYATDATETRDANHDERACGPEILDQAAKHGVGVGGRKAHVDGSHRWKVGAEHASKSFEGVEAGRQPAPPQTG